MSSFVAFGSQWISLAERSCSSFALVVSCLCAGEDLSPPSSGDADVGYQWEIYTDEGWVPYWDSQAYVIQGNSLSSRAKSVCLTMRDKPLLQNSVLPL
jgi:hypothetical protein